MKKLRALLKKHPQIEDFIIFGSFVKGKFRPNDIDVVMITVGKERELQREIKKRLGEKVHLENYTFREIFYEPLIINILAEGYSVKTKKFLRGLLGIKPLKMFIYNLKGFERVKKVQFSTALTKMLKTLQGERIAAGSVLIPVKEASAFEDFLNTWGLKYKTREYLVF